MAAMQLDNSARTLRAILGSVHSDFEGIAISGVQLDSRKVVAGDLFLAMPGDVHDGRQFIEQAVANGAVAVVAEPPVAGYIDAVSVPVIEVPELACEAGVIASRFFSDPSAELQVVGVTGTNGKTTTCALMAQLLRSLGKTCGVIGTLGASLDGAVSAAPNTTPDPVSLQSQLAQWRDMGVDAVGMEVSSHALVQGRVSGVQFRTAILTNLSRDHLDYHETMAAYGRAKMQLFMVEGLRNAVVNLDDDFGLQILTVIEPDVRVVTYSLRPDRAADIHFSDICFHGAGVTATLNTPWGKRNCTSPLRGQFNLSNLAGAMAALLVNGEDLDALLEAARALVPVPGRMQSIENDSGLQVIIDYAHTPDALQQVLLALRPHVKGSLITVFGCGGDRDPGKRSVMGRLACELSDRVVVTSDNPRSEHPLAVLRQIEAGCTGDFQLLVDRADAIAHAIADAKEGDCVLIAGKGHENYQIIEEQHHHFSDEEQALQALDMRVER
ncbi:MAG: UDP-N-acetylmuramoyl-L-alanyl-D-glutamate--2,6-diaminopimelate ligase [Halioglobus sp.]